MDLTEINEGVVTTCTDRPLTLDEKISAFANSYLPGYDCPRQVMINGRKEFVSIQCANTHIPIKYDVKTPSWFGGPPIGRGDNLKFENGILWIIK